MRASGRVTIATTALVVVVPLLTPPPAAADDPVPPEGEVLIVTPDDPWVVGGQQASVLVDGSGEIVIDNPGGSPAIPPHCLALAETPGTTRVCTGVMGDPANPVEVRNATFHGVPGAEGLYALEEEAVDLVAGLHGITDRQAIRAYAAPTIRAYMADRIIEILDRKLYGQPMTELEELVYESVRTAYHHERVEAARRVLREYHAWRVDKCGYVPPPPPPGSGIEPVPNDYRLSNYCRDPRWLVYSYLTDTPPLRTFETWGAFREADELFGGIDAATLGESAAAVSSEATRLYLLLAATGVAGGVTVGLSTSTAGTSLAQKIVGSFSGPSGVASEIRALKASLEIAVDSDDISNLATQLFEAQQHAKSFRGVVGVTRGASVALAAFGVLSSIVDLVMGAIELADDQDNIRRITRVVDRALAEDDPFEMAAWQPLYAGLDFESREEPSLPDGLRGYWWLDEKRLLEPFSRQAGARARLQADLVRWSTVGPDGYRPDPVPDGPAYRPGVDGLFRTAPGGTEVATLDLQAPPESVDHAGRRVVARQVHLHDNWLVVRSRRPDGSWSVPRRQLSVDYVAPDGRPGTMSAVRVVRDGQLAHVFGLTEAPLVDDDVEFLEGMTTRYDDLWAFRRPNGSTMRVTRVPNPPAQPQLSMLPAAIGRMVPHHEVELRANPSVQLRTFDATYRWTVEHLSPDGEWEEVAAGAGQELTTTPVAPGDYRATVAYTGTDDVGDPVTLSAVVPFHITSPPPQVIWAHLEHGTQHDGRMFLDLRVGSEAAEDEFRVDVTWARSVDSGARRTESFVVECRPAGAGCDTGAFTGPDTDPQNPAWSRVPVLALPADTVTLPWASIAISDSRGTTTFRTVPVTGENRPLLRDVRERVVVPIGDDGPGFYPIAEVQPAPDAEPPPAGVPALFWPEPTDADEALPVGLRLETRERGDGTWEVGVAGFAQAEQIGAYGFTFQLEQEPRGRGLLTAAETVSVEVVASADDEPRALVRGSTTEIVQHRTLPPLWVEVANPEVDPDSGTLAPFEGTVRCRVTGVIDGRTYLDEVCRQGAPFPWPRDVTDGSYEVTVQAFDPDGEPVGAPHTARTMFALVRPGLAVAQPKRGGRYATATLEVYDLPSSRGLGWVTPPFSGSGVVVTCSLDGGRFRRCLDDGRERLLRTPGPHTLTVRVRAVDGVVATRTVRWRVATPPARLRVVRNRAAAEPRQRVRLRVAGLLPRERYVVRLAGKVVARGHARADGRARSTFRVPPRTRPGPKVLRIDGATRNRTWRGTLRVLR
ncbi:hypothetical protein [Nocardioides sp. TF02-7]|uniref:hypothetical protein n=1 Tax=Nocardioides sp. TF02-7 TaxID=2917724 RepID=UPI001F05314F|nr:hypothetical protein [Nocardioides sp. TF02-7]UMG94439.1 hypothetical protein MF408_10900 [Nocardioides sp. TF02-7]